MRLYALLLGTLLTVGLVSVTAIALDSVRADRSAGSRGTAADPPVADRVWYGGNIAPIIVKARSTPTATLSDGAAAQVREPREAAARFSKRGRRGE